MNSEIGSGNIMSVSYFSAKIVIYSVIFKLYSCKLLNDSSKYSLNQL